MSKSKEAIDANIREFTAHAFKEIEKIRAMELDKKLEQTLIEAIIAKAMVDYYISEITEMIMDTKIKR